MNDLTARALEKTQAASDRVRWVMLVMQVACIIVFMAAWHEMPNGWTFGRVTTAQAALWWLDCGTMDHSELSNSNNLSEEPEVVTQRHDHCHIVDEITSYSAPSSSCPPDYTRSPQHPYCDSELQHARQWLGTRGFSPNEARDLLKDLLASSIERIINVSVPFLGISFDINDLSVLSAVTFIFLLTLLLFNTRREAENLSALFDGLTGQELKDVYKILSMTQVFTIPPKLMPNSSDPFGVTEGIWRWLARLLLLTPLIVESVVLWCDFHTIPAAVALSSRLAEFAVRAGPGCFLLMILPTVLCVRGSMSVGHQWNTAYDNISNSGVATAAGP
jgi:hypothetical protein